MRDPWRHRLSEYLDEDLPIEEREELELHLTACPSCREVLADLESLVHQAAELEDHLPEQDLWPRIQAGLDAPADVAPARRPRIAAPGRVVSLSMGQLLAACLVVMVVSGGMGWLGASFSTSEEPAADPLARNGSPQPGAELTPASSADGLAAAMAQYQLSIEQLETALRASVQNLDDETRETILHNLRDIDQAIFESRQALERDPESEFLNAHLARNIKSKVRLLRQANELAANRI